MDCENTANGNSAELPKAGVSDEYQLMLYPVEKEFIGKVVINPQKNDPKAKKINLLTIVILDRSGSMGDSVEQFVKIVIPQVFQKLDYSNDAPIHLITFDSYIEVVEASIGLLPHLDISCRGLTFMKDAIEELKKIILCQANKDFRGIRLLTISDGDIDDQEVTQESANELAALIGRSFEINSQAVRLFTSEMQPDTRALSSLMQLNNVTKVNLLDLDSQLSNEDLSTAISKLFIDDGLSYQITLNSEESIFKKVPWSSEYTSDIKLYPGDNIFWLDKVPSKDLNIENVKVQIQVQPELNLEVYEKLLRKKVETYMTQLKILKIVDTADATTAISNIVTYFQSRENYILSKEQDVQFMLNNPSLQSRLSYLKTIISRRNKTFSLRMAEIANDEKISQLNSAQQAEYLRTMDISKNSRALARRALNQGIDFNETARKEVQEMAKHIDELKDIDDKDHFESFYSRCTTLGGIRALCQMEKENLLDEFDANEILLLLNVVGVACSGPIGEFPDPMTWRVEKLFLGCYVSLADVLTAYIQSNGSTLKTPATEKVITNVIPVFDDNRIALFLKKYAPSLLEYTCSIGMRRVIADVPMTCGYTMCAGVWKMLELLNKKKSELHLKTFELLVKNYCFFAGKYFDHILPFIKNQEQGIYSYYIANNGITNMISPLIKLYEMNDQDKLQFVPDILRALYTYEIWQAVRREYKNKDNSELIAKDMIKKLLGIDIEKNKVILKPLFVEEPERKDIKFYDEFHLDEEYFTTVVKSFYYLGYVTLIPKYFEAVMSDNTNSILNVPSVSENTICEALNINYDLKTFHLYNIVQALLFTTKASRVDSDKEVMKIIDLKSQAEGEKMVRDYIRKLFENQYSSEVAVKIRTEHSELSQFLVRSIIQATTHEEFVSLMRNGATRGKIHTKIANSASLGYLNLKQKLVDLNENVPLRTNKIRIFLLGRDYMKNDELVWNNGGVMFVSNVTEFSNVYKSFSSEAEWNQIYTEYKERGIHIYRDLPNRHGHGNEKPSYWAFGYSQLDEYRKFVTEEEFKQYCEEHPICCGVPKLIESLA